MFDFLTGIWYISLFCWFKNPIISFQNFRAHPCDLPKYPGVIFYTLFVASNPCVLYLIIKIIINLIEFLFKLNSVNEEIDSESPEESVQQNQGPILPTISRSIENGHSSNMIFVKPYHR